MSDKQNTQLIERKTARCPFCDAFLFTGIYAEGVQVKCKGKDGKPCGRMIEINITEKGVEMMEVQQRTRDSPFQFATNQ